MRFNRETNNVNDGRKCLRLQERLSKVWLFMEEIDEEGERFPFF